ncbi:efflux transporter periplasmic adaptor subunit [Ventosimonas gracilis]|uniref:Efflux transporter periplasmic adaptor subunit n=1 Tax=Ventosimonas gracilis TaxID=1680762 RepID=A0A139SXU1_9GAMM|nr:efflux RND transporter periplasmic adaptor subunit [Ventosimonas gracilis]KXU39438.1 efflux transporter periplasmic adaptor subunit [Ventosimonas gracilis]
MLLRRMLLMLLLVIAVVAGLAIYKVKSIQQQIAQFTAPRPPIAVSMALAEQQPWQERLSAIGSLTAAQGIDLTAEVAGTVRELLFKSGEKVSKGQPLLQLDDAVERATLAAAEADLGLSRVEFERIRTLLEKKLASQSDFDRQSAQLQRNSATVAQLKALLAKKRIIAPFAGTIGIRQVDVGDFLNAGTSIATLQDLSTLYVDFFLPEQAVPQLAVGQRVQLEVAAWPGQSFSGTLTAISPKVDEATRNVQVRASLPNPEEKLLPGMFANLDVLLSAIPQRIVLPETAITYSLYGNSVYVIVAKPAENTEAEQTLTVERRFVETGARRGGKVVIVKGLNAGEQVVSSGQLKLDNGARVAIAEDNALKLSEAAH